MEDLYLHCELRKVRPLFKAQLHGPCPIMFPTSPASLIVPIFFLWQLYNDTKPSIHPSDHVSIHPSKNHTNMVEDCLPRSIQTQDVLCSAFEKKKYHGLVKIEENLLEVTLSREEMCSARYLGMLTGQGLPSLWSGQGGFQGYQSRSVQFPLPSPYISKSYWYTKPGSNTPSTSKLSLILLSHQARMNQDLHTTMSLWHRWWHSALLSSVANTAVQKARQHIHFLLYLPGWSPWSSELHPLHLHNVFRTKSSAWHTDTQVWLPSWNWWPWPWMEKAIQQPLKGKHLVVDTAGVKYT